MCGDFEMSFINRVWARLFEKHDSRTKLHEYWRNPDGMNLPKDYEEGAERSMFLVSFMGTPTQKKVLEIGCNVGRNLFFLKKAGYTQVEGIEINTEAAARCRDKGIPVRCGAVEDIIPSLPSEGYDTVFTMAVLEHIPTESEWVFMDIARIAARRIITIEDEHEHSHRHFPRNYAEVFGQFGFKCVKQCRVKGLPRSFVARYFEKEAKK